MGLGGEIMKDKIIKICFIAVFSIPAVLSTAGALFLTIEKNAIKIPLKINYKKFLSYEEEINCSIDNLVDNEFFHSKDENHKARDYLSSLSYTPISPYSDIAIGDRNEGIIIGMSYQNYTALFTSRKCTFRNIEEDISISYEFDEERCAELYKIFLMEYKGVYN